MSTASSDIERSQDRELPLMKLYSSKKTPLAFMAPWLTVDGKPEMVRKNRLFWGRSRNGYFLSF